MPVLVGIWDIIDSLLAIGKQYRKKQWISVIWLHLIY